MTRNRIILITGPTASGKSALALQLARTLHTSIISADSRQCYREMNIGVAKPSAAELSEIPHYFVNTHSIHDEVNAATFAALATEAADRIFMTTRTAVMAGGTGLYIKAFFEGLDDIPTIAPGIREDIVQRFKQNGLAWLQQEVKDLDPLFYSDGEIQNPHRLIRALEVKLATGHSIRQYQQRKAADRSFEIIKYGVDVPRNELYERINQRVLHMMEDGLLEEVRRLEPYKDLYALQTVGYTELFEYLGGRCTLAAAVERIQANTRHYAKRQWTWFRKDPEIKWISSLSELET